VNLSIVLVLNVLFVAVFYKELKIAAFDPELATTLGINASFMHYALMVMVAITTVANFEAVGSILVIAMLIVPGAAAHLLTDRLGVMIVISLLAAIASAVGGHILAAFGPGWLGFHDSANTAAMMSVVAGAILFAAILFAPEQGVISRVWHRAALTAQIAQQDILGMLYRWRERSGRHVRRAEVLAAVGDGHVARRELRRLIRKGELHLLTQDSGEPSVELTAAGLAHASQIIGSHRLWESYLAKHFDLAPDHLHAPAERMEHFIDPRLRDELREQLRHPTHDPQGKPIPGEKD
jgi:manganese/zinc/iron transport system permease protein